MSIKKLRLVLCLAVVAFFANTLYAVTAVAQQQARTLKRLPIERKEPVSIVKLKVKGKAVSPDEPFSSDDDWLNDFAVTVKNTSNKAILFAAIDLQFPRPAGSAERIAIDDISYGNSAVVVRSPTTAERSSGLMPGQTVDIQPSAGHFDLIREHLPELGYSPRIEKVAFKIGKIIFEDDTMWYAGSLFRRDPNDPRSWINTESARMNVAKP